MKCTKFLGICENLSFVEGSFEYLMVARMKAVCGASTVTSSSDGGTQASVLDAIYRGRSL